MKSKFPIGLVLVLLIGIVAGVSGNSGMQSNIESSYSDELDSTEKSLEDYSIATFSGGCFWCTEADFEKHVGVIDAVSGYAGGSEVEPSYNDVASGKTSHREGVQVYYDPSIISYNELLDIYWRHFDPTDDGGSFVDRGFQYSSAIFYHNDEQKRLAESSKLALQDSGIFSDEIVTPVIEFSSFYDAEGYHQDYYEKNSLKYNFYRSRSGRDQFIEMYWDGAPNFIDTSFVKPSDEELRKILSPIQYEVTQNDGTERPFDNEYWDNKEPGIYVDIVSGEPLFSSTHKYKSGTGWPSFWQPLVPENIVEKEDRKLLITRTEIRSKNADSHVGHVFNDGPEPTGLRYCMNSAALRFVHKDDLASEGYSEFEYLFE